MFATFPILSMFSTSYISIADVLTPNGLVILAGTDSIASAVQQAEATVQSGLYWIYLFCSIVGTFLLLLQFLMSIMGFGEGIDGDVDFDADADFGGDFDGDVAAGMGDAADAAGAGSHSLDLARFLSFRVLVAVMAFFGIIGMWGHSTGQNPWLTLMAAMAVGLFVGFCVGKVMNGLKRMGSDGTTHLENAVGLSATVYVMIPEKRAMAGKIQVILDGRSETMAAVTDGPQLTSGTAVIITEIIGKDTAVVSEKK